MPITQRGSIYQTSFANTTGVNLTTPTGVQNGDLLVAIFVMGNTTASVAPNGAGWTEVTAATAGAAVKEQVFWKIASSEGSTQSFTCTSPTTIEEAFLIAFSGVDVATPIVQSGTYTSGLGSTTAPALPSLTSTRANSLYLGIIGLRTTSVDLTITEPSGFTELIEAVDGGSPRVVASLSAKSFVSIGATGTQTGSLDTTAQTVGHGLLLNPKVEILGDASLSGAASVSAQGRLNLSSGANLAGAGAIATTASIIRQAAAQLAAQGDLAAITRVERLAAALFSGSATVIGAGGFLFNTGAVLAGSADLAALAEVFKGSGPVALAGASTVFASAVVICAAAANLSGQAQLASAARNEINAALGLSGSAALVAGAGFLRTGAAALAGSAQLQATPQVIRQFAATLQAAAQLSAQAVKLVTASAHLSGSATISVIIGADATLVTITALGDASGKYIAVTPTLASSGNILYIEQTDLIPTTGDIILSVPPAINSKYDVVLADGRAFNLATKIVPDGENLGLVVLDAASISGSLRTSRIESNVFNLLGQRTERLMIRANRPCIDFDGNFLTPEPTPLPVDESGFVSIDLKPTGDLYAPDGGTVLYEIVRDLPGYPMIGKRGFTVPVGTGPQVFTFSVNDGAIVVE